MQEVTHDVRFRFHPRVLRTCSRRFFATALSDCWPRPSRRKSPSGSTRTLTSRMTRGRRQVVRNGYLPKRTILTGIGPVEVEQPRVLDRRGSGAAKPFSSKILPPYLRKTKSLEELIPWLYLKGISTGDFSEALSALVGPDCPGLSASTITRLKEVWEEEFQEWTKRSLEGKQYVYLWADGVHFNIRLEEDRQCILVLMGATADGQKELIAIADGYRESEQSWKALLLGREGPRPGRSIPSWPRATAPWASGRRSPKVFPDHARRSAAGSTRRPTCSTSCPSDCSPRPRRRCTRSGWPRRRQTPTQAFDLFLATYEAKYPKACECLAKDRDELLAFYDFPAEHWKHLRTTNPIESTFATVRLRHRRTKGSGSRTACLTMVFKLMQSAAKTLAAAQRLPAPARRHPRSSIHRRNQTPTSRRLTTPHPQLIAISPILVAWLLN